MSPATGKNLILSAALAFAALGILRYYLNSMDAAEVVRRLAGMRTAVALFRLSKGSAPVNFYDVVTSGSLEAPLKLKLKWHGASSKVRPAPVLQTTDTGGWGYVNDPKSRDFGTVFIDCAHRDEKGRWWSEF
ncbi:MAG: hypothetical protein KKH28_01205 [Elusimicrobia bacterium]|nr:hypothetical protein [Elusimicrobiota bacterium]